MKIILTILVLFNCAVMNRTWAISCQIMGRGEKYTTVKCGDHLGNVLNNDLPANLKLKRNDYYTNKGSSLALFPQSGNQEIPLIIFPPDNPNCGQKSLEILKIEKKANGTWDLFFIDKENNILKLSDSDGLASLFLATQSLNKKIKPSSNISDPILLSDFSSSKPILLDRLQALIQHYEKSNCPDLETKKICGERIEEAKKIKERLESITPVTWGDINKLNIFIDKLENSRINPQHFYLQSKLGEIPKGEKIYKYLNKKLAKNMAIDTSSINLSDFFQGGKRLDLNDKSCFFTEFKGSFELAYSRQIFRDAWISPEASSKK